MTTPMNNMPLYLHVYVTQNFTPIQSFNDPETGRPYSRVTMMEDFKTEFRASLVMSNDTAVDVTQEVKWHVEDEPKRPHGEVIQETDAPNVLTGINRGFVKLTVSLKTELMQMETWVELEILESDLLVYAPDGCVYRVPGAVWIGQNDKSSKVERISWTEKDRERLPEEVWNMLANEVTLANVPNPVQKPFDGSQTTSRERIDNVTCFLLNLNSVMLSYSPRPTPGRSTPTAETQTTTLRRKG